MQVSYQNPQADAWHRAVLDNSAAFPLRFSCGGRIIHGFPESEFARVDQSEHREGGRLVTEIVFQKDDCLFVTLRCAFYGEYGISEWTVWFENRGQRDTDVLSDAETVLTFPGKYPVLRGILGDHGNDYRPYALDVASQPRHFESNSGRATHVNFPYFNLEYGDGGVILAIGWAGTWRAGFRYDAASGVTMVTARSVNRLNAKLRPGEKIRTALFVRAPYRVRSEDYAVNCTAT